MEVAPADPTRVSGSALAVSRSRCWTRMLMRATIRLSCTPWTRSGTMGFLGPRWPGAGSRQQLPCLDPDGWLVRMLQANRNENPAAELKARAVKPIPIATGELPLPRGKLYPLTRSPLMGGTFSPILCRSASRRSADEAEFSCPPLVRWAPLAPVICQRKRSAVESIRR